METEVGSIKYTLDLDDAKFKQGASEASGDVDKLGETMNGLTPIGVAIGAMLASLAEKFIEFAEQSIQETLHLGEQMEFVKTNLDNLTGGVKNTNDMLAGLQDLTSKGLFKPAEIETYTQKLLQMGVPQGKIVGLIHDMAAATVGSSGSLEEAGGKMDTLTTLFGYMQDKGGLTVSMLGRFSRSLGIPVVDAMAKSLGMTTDQFESMKGTTKVTSEMLAKAFDDMATGSGKFSKSIVTDSNTMEARQGALNNRFDELKLSILGMSATGEVVKGGFYDKISTATSNLITFIDKHKAAMDALIVTIGIGTLAIGILVVGIIAKTISLGLGTIAHIAMGVAQAAQTITTIALTAATWLLNVALFILTSPISLVILAIVALIAIGVLLITHWSQVQSVGKTVFSAIGSFFSSLGSIVHGVVNSIVSDVKNMVNSVVDSINGLIHGVNSVSSKVHLPAIPDIPHFEQGGYVPQTGLALLHAGEYVLSKDMISGNKPSQVRSNGQQIVINVARMDRETDIESVAREIGFRVASRPR